VPGFSKVLGIVQGSSRENEETTGCNGCHVHHCTIPGCQVCIIALVTDNLPGRSSRPQRGYLGAQFGFAPVDRLGLDLGDRQRLVVVAEQLGRAEVGLRRPAGSAEMLRPRDASHHAEGSGVWP